MAALPETDIEGALKFVKRSRVGTGLLHAASKVAGVTKDALGPVLPIKGIFIACLLMKRTMPHNAKRDGRNRVCKAVEQ